MNQTSDLPYNPSQSNTHHGNGGSGGGGGGHSKPPTNNETNDTHENESEPPQDNETSEPPANHTTNYVYVFPEQTNASLGHYFSVAILCEPVQPIKSWEMTLDYDPAFLHANQVIQGNIFEGYQSFSSPNVTINNINGTITKLYSLILGAGLMTNKTGILSIIQFTTYKLGTTHLNIEMIGLTNDTMYLPVERSNGTVTSSHE